jgi:hypothetical protein
MQFLTHFLPFLWGRLLATPTMTVTVSAVAVTVTGMIMSMTVTGVRMTVIGMVMGVTVTGMIMCMTMTSVCMTVTHDSFDVLLHDLVLWWHVGLLGPLEGGRLVMAVTMVVMRMIVRMHQLARQQHSQK